MSPLELTAPIRILAETKTFVQQLDNFELVFLLIEPLSLTHGHSLGTAAVTSLQASMISHVGARFTRRRMSTPRRLHSSNRFRTRDPNPCGAFAACCSQPVWTPRLVAVSERSG